MKQTVMQQWPRGVDGNQNRVVESQSLSYKPLQRDGPVTRSQTKKLQVLELRKFENNSPNKIY